MTEEREREAEGASRGDERTGDGVGGGGGGGLGGWRVVVFEMIRPICASFPRCIPRLAARVAANRHGFRTTASSVEALLNATFRGKDEQGKGGNRARVCGEERKREEGGTKKGRVTRGRKGGSLLLSRGSPAGEKKWKTGIAEGESFSLLMLLPLPSPLRGVCVSLTCMYVCRF